MSEVDIQRDDRHLQSPGQDIFKTQAVIARSFGEFELDGVNRASTKALAVLGLLEDFGTARVNVRMGMDANAAMDIVQRRA